MGKWLYASLLAIILAAGGCGQSDEEQVEEAIERDSGGEASVSIDEESFSIQTGEGSFRIDQGGGLELPENFPDDVPVMDDASISMSTAADEMVQVMFSVDEPLDEVLEHYKEEMADNDWTSESSVQTPEGSMLSFTKDENRTAVITVNRDGEKTQVNLMIETRGE